MIVNGLDACVECVLSLEDYREKSIQIGDEVEMFPCPDSPKSDRFFVTVVKIEMIDKERVRIEMLDNKKVRLITDAQDKFDD